MEDTQISRAFAFSLSLKPCVILNLAVLGTMGIKQRLLLTLLSTFLTQISWNIDLKLFLKLEIPPSKFVNLFIWFCILLVTKETTYIWIFYSNICARQQWFLFQIMSGIEMDSRTLSNHSTSWGYGANLYSMGLDSNQKRPRINEEKEEMHQRYWWEETRVYRSGIWNKPKEIILHCFRLCNLF